MWFPRLAHRLSGLVLAATVAGCPLQVTISHDTLGFSAHLAAAQGNSGGNGQGNGAENGNAGGAGNGSGNNGSNGNSNSNGRGNDGAQAGRGGTSAPSGRGRGLVNAGVTLSVHHRDGISEHIGQGRFEMRDAQGRVIVNRPAKPADYTRLRAMSD